MIREYKNFLDKSYFEEISNVLCGNNFSWFYEENITYDYLPSKDINDHGFFHWIVRSDGKKDSPYEQLFMPLLMKIKECVKKNKIMRARIDMTMLTTEKMIHEYHQDFKRENIATILYINETDGKTIIKENGTEKTFQPEINKLLTFDGTLWHTGCSPLRHKRRILINSNYE